MMGVVAPSVSRRARGTQIRGGHRGGRQCAPQPPRCGRGSPLLTLSGVSTGLHTGISCLVKSRSRGRLERATGPPAPRRAQQQHSQRRRRPAHDVSTGASPATSSLEASAHDMHMPMAAGARPRRAAGEAQKRRASARCQARIAPSRRHPANARRLTQARTSHRPPPTIDRPTRPSSPPPRSPPLPFRPGAPARRLRARAQTVAGRRRRRGVCATSERKIEMVCRGCEICHPCWCVRFYVPRNAQLGASRPPWPAAAIARCHLPRACKTIDGIAAAGAAWRWAHGGGPRPIGSWMGGRPRCGAMRRVAPRMFSSHSSPQSITTSTRPRARPPDPSEAPPPHPHHFLSNRISHPSSSIHVQSVGRSIV